MLGFDRWEVAHAICCLLASGMLLGAAEPNSDFQDRLLDRHNVERVALGLPPLRWDEKLANEAKTWADYLAANNRFEHSPTAPGESVGENIWGGTPGRFSPERMVGRWIEEKRYFKAGIFPGNSLTGNSRDVSHYTQVIWKSTRTVGCASSRGANEEILVCRYQGAGNIHGHSPL